ncbi:MAG TPA: dienelactone hydrolase family protein, partial [Acidimicrobiia bacterium]
GHGFHCNVRDGYVADAAAAGWRRTLDWFSTHLAS